MEELTKRLELTFHIMKDSVLTEVLEPESNTGMCFHVPYSPDEHPEFDEQLCMEIYSWFSMWIDEMEDDNEKDAKPYRVLTEEEKEAARMVL